MSTWARPETTLAPPHPVTGRCPSIHHWPSVAAGVSGTGNGPAAAADRDRHNANRSPRSRWAKSPYCRIRTSPLDMMCSANRRRIPPPPASSPWATVGVVLPGEGDPIVLELNQTVIARGDPVCVPSQVFHACPARQRAPWHRPPNPSGTTPLSRSPTRILLPDGMEKRLQSSQRLQVMDPLAGCLLGDQLPIPGSQPPVAERKHTIAAQGAAPHGAVLRPALRCNE